MDEWWLSPEERDESIARAAKTASLRNSITGGESAVYGAAGEIVVRDYCVYRLGLEVEDEPTFDYDLIVAGRRVDVKAKRTNCEPRPDYNATIAAANTHQQCDYYVFVRVAEDLSVAWICGVIRPVDFYRAATLRRKGEIDGDAGWEFKADCYNLTLGALAPMLALTEEWT